MAEPIIAFDGVWKKFQHGEHHDSLRDLIPALIRSVTSRPASALNADEFWVLRDVSFEVKSGQALGIIGPNGAGKSTALKLLTRLLKPTLGTTRLKGRVSALIELAAGFHPDLTGRENIFLQGAIMGMRRADILRRFDDIVSFAGIPDFVDTPIKRYSSGMNARLGFAIAAHLDPEVLLVDEVLAVGDFSFQQKCYERLRLFRKEGTPIAFVSHNMQAISSLCDRVLLLRPNEPPLLAGVNEALLAYTALGRGPADPRVRLHLSTVNNAGNSGQALDSCQTEPCAPITVTIQIEATETLPRCIVGLEVVRADGVVMFNGSPMFDAEPATDLVPGVRIQMRFTFKANLLRGTYAINIHLADELRGWRPIALERVGLFTVHETNRVGGYAELDPVYDVSIVGSTDKSRRTPLLGVPSPS